MIASYLSSPFSGPEIVLLAGFVVALLLTGRRAR